MNFKRGIELRRTSAAEQIADHLVKMILNGELAAGELIREGELSAAMSVSRNSLREAVRILEQSRLVSYKMHKGTVVNPPSASGLEDLLSARLALEISGAYADPGQPELSELTNALLKLDAACRIGQIAQIVEADLGFHAAVVGLVGSQRLNDFYGHIKTEMAYYLTVVSIRDREYEKAEEFIYQEHKKIHDALQSGDKEFAAQLLREHLQYNTERIAEVLPAETTAKVAPST